MTVATARAVYRFSAEASVHVEVSTDEGFPDSVAEVTTRCRHLFREVLTDWNAMADEETPAD